MSLPDGDGIELLKEVRAEERTNDLPVIAVTNCAIASDIDRLIAQGFGGVVTKPIEIRSFANDVERFARMYQ